MASKKNNEKSAPSELEEVQEEDFIEEVAPEPVAAAPVAVAAPVAKPRVMSFTQWASLRGFRPQHLGGMRAFLKNPSQLRSVDSWDKVFETY